MARPTMSRAALATRLLALFPAAGVWHSLADLRSRVNESSKLPSPAVCRATLADLVAAGLLQSRAATRRAKSSGFGREGFLFQVTEYALVGEDSSS